jgi:hypothetical protein
VGLSSGFSASGIGGLEVLSEESGLVLGRGWREDAGGGRKDVLIVLPASQPPASATLDRLAHEYSLRDHLDAPWAVRPLDLVRERGRTMLVLDDPGAGPLGRFLGSPMELGGFLRLAEALAAALHGLHERGLIQRTSIPRTSWSTTRQVRSG